MQNIVNNRMQILQFSRQQLLQIMIQLQPVLHHAVAKPGGQRRIPPIQPIPGNIIFQHAVGPARLLAAGDQHIQRRFSGTHT